MKRCLNQTLAAFIVGLAFGVLVCDANALETQKHTQRVSFVCAPQEDKAEFIASLVGDKPPLVNMESGDNLVGNRAEVWTFDGGFLYIVSVPAHGLACVMDVVGLPRTKGEIT